MRYSVQPCISAVYQWCAVNPGSVRSGKCVGGFVTIHTFHKMENKSCENLGACHFSVSLAGSQLNFTLSSFSFPYCLIVILEVLFSEVAVGNLCFLKKDS